MTCRENCSIKTSQDWHGCIMRSTVIGEEGVQPYKFSSCSADQFRQWMDGGQALCLLNRPNEVRRNAINILELK